jgi:hypothetical protein
LCDINKKDMTMSNVWDSALTIPQAVRKVEAASQPGGVQFAKLPEDANQVYFSLLADKSTYCGRVLLHDVSVGRTPRVRITVDDSSALAPPPAGFFSRILGGSAKYAKRPEAIEKAVEVLKRELPPF